MNLSKILRSLRKDSNEYMEDHIFELPRKI